jgi:radical SAM protein with 4Fe4S-binding SPASM domain
MLVAGWSFTDCCDLACEHCYNRSGKRNPDELTLEESIRVADKLKTVGVGAVNFGGGECALRPDFIDLYKYLYSLGIKISYTTNGRHFDVIGPYLYLFHDIGVSIDFASEKKHDAFRGRAGTFNRAISCIENLVKKSVDTEIVTCLTRKNCSAQELQAIYDLSKKLNVDYWRLNRFRPNGRGKDNNNSLELTHDELHSAYLFLSQYVPKGTPVPEPIFRAAFGGAYHLPGDPSGFTAFRIQANGEVTPSVFLKESGGNIKNRSIESIVDSQIFRRIRERKAEGKCKQCPAYFHCNGGDAGASYLSLGHFNGPDPMCWLSPSEVSQEVFPVQGNNWNVHELYLCTLYIPIKGANNERTTSS